MRIRLAISALFLLAFSTAQAADVDIPSQPMGEALRALGKETNLNVLFETQQLRGLMAPAVKDAKSAEDALTQLLKGTGLTYRFIEEGTVTVVRIEQAVAVTTDNAESLRLAQNVEQKPFDRTADAHQQDPEQEIVVTGSHIRGANAAGSSPVIVFDKEAIEKTGVATVEQFFAKLPQNFGGGSSTSGTASMSPDRDGGRNDARGSAIQLRGLGTGTTLTLINGRRVTSSNQFQYVDTTLIPMSAVERIEVLTDGASAIYGSDAIGGVVNIVLRRDFTGYETQARYGTVTTGGYKEYQAAQTGGWAWNGGHALLSYEYLLQDNLLATDKSFSSGLTFKPYDLYPESKRQSVYLTASQSITESLSVEMSGSFADRDVDTTSTSASGMDLRTPSTKQYDVSLGTTLDLPHEWQARLSGAAGKSEIESRRTRTTATAVTAVAPIAVDSDSRYADLAADGPVFHLPAGDVHAALGASHRRDGYTYSGSPIVRDERNVSSAYGEIRLPILRNLPGARRLDIDAAVRYDEYSDFGSTTNPKYGFVWEPISGVALRGTYGTSFRAPIFTDLAPTGVTVTGNYYPYAGATSPTGRIFVLTAGGNNANLGPETSTAWTAGIKLSPEWLPSFSLDLGFYDIEYKDRIAPGFAGNSAALFASPVTPYASILTFNPPRALVEEFRQIGLSGSQYQIFRTGTNPVPAALDEDDVEVILDNRLRNNAEAHQRGIDLQSSWGVGVGSSQLSFSIAGQYILASTQKVIVGAPEADVLNRTFLPIDLRLRGGMDFSHGNWMSALFVNYTDSYTDPLNTVDPHVDSWSTVDLNVTYRFPSMSFALNVQNLFDRNPPYVITSFRSGFDSSNANPLGRLVALSATYKW